MAATDNKIMTGASIPAIKNFVKSSTSHRNLLDNPWFTVNQRGNTSNTSGYFEYPVDRWLCDGYSSTQNGITVDNSRYLLHRMENVDYLNGKTVTVSVLFSDGTIHSGTGTFLTNSASANDIFSDESIRCYNELNNGYTTLVLRNISGSSLTIKAVKLEIGSVSTLAYDSPPNYTEELMKCKRYFQYYGFMSFTGWHNSYNTYNLIPPMRIAPTVNDTNRELVYDGTYHNDLAQDIYIVSSPNYLFFINGAAVANVTFSTRDVYLDAEL